MTAVYSFTVGGTSLPLPGQANGFEMEYFPIGSAGRVADGSYRVQYTTSKWRVRVNWEGLSQDERQTVWNVYVGRLTSTRTVILPNGITFTAFADLGSWVESPWFSPHRNQVFYNVSFVFVEA